MSASILRNLVSSIFNVNPVSVKLSGEMPENFCETECHSSGNLYSYCKNIEVFSFNAKDGFKAVIGNNSGNSQNANGSWNSENVISFADCAMHKEAIFFLVKIADSGWQEGREDWDYTSYTLFKAPNFKEYLDKVNNNDLARWEQWLNS